MNFQTDVNHVILTLDAGGTNFVFSAMKGCNEITQSIRFDSYGNDLRKSINTIIEGFLLIKKNIFPLVPEAISIAFPGPCDYQKGIIWKQKNLNAYEGGIPLKYILEKEFGIPVIMNNDADLFAYGEAQQGLLWKINQSLSYNGSTKRYSNLIGISLGTGFGSGIITNGNLIQGDNSSSGEIWAFRNKKYPYSHAETSVSAQGIVEAYKRFANIKDGGNLTPKKIAEIALGNNPGNTEAAILAFNEFGEILGDALAQIITLIDGIVVLGGGLSHSYHLFINSVIKELNSGLKNHEGKSIKRLNSDIFNLEDKNEYDLFCKKEEKLISVPFTEEKIIYEGSNRIGIGKSHHPTSHSIAIGAYLLALKHLNNHS